jgi:hypothetical protein
MIVYEPVDSEIQVEWDSQIARRDDLAPKLWIVPQVLLCLRCFNDLVQLTRQLHESEPIQYLQLGSDSESGCGCSTVVNKKR